MVDHEMVDQFIITSLLIFIDRNLIIQYQGRNISLTISYISHVRFGSYLEERGLWDGEKEEHLRQSSSKLVKSIIKFLPSTTTSTTSHFLERVRWSLLPLSQSCLLMSMTQNHFIFRSKRKLSQTISQNSNMNTTKRKPTRITPIYNL